MKANTRKFKKAVIKVVIEESKLSAVKFVREQLKIGLKESKDYVDELVTHRDLFKSTNAENVISTGAMAQSNPMTTNSSDNPQSNSWR